MNRLLAFVTLAMILPLGQLAAQPAESGRVRVSVLSKQMKSVRKGVSARIRLEFPPECIIETPGGSVEHLSGDIEFVKADTGLLLRIGNRVQRARQKLIVRREGGGEFRVSLDGTVRRYSLPLEIVHDKGGYRLFIAEDRWRYCLDSARAEYGPMPRSADEAVEALSLLILARCEAVKHARHNGFDYCDLTHCQVYRGRMPDTGPREKRPEYTCVGTRFEPLFHSRCGGRTFDGRVFGADRAGIAGVEDWYDPGKRYLCKDMKSSWQRELSDREAREILAIDLRPEEGGGKLVFDRAAMKVCYRAVEREFSFAPEDFRLRINRIKGWSFIRSNNYEVATVTKGDEPYHRFRGYGLGHGVGFCQHGAVSLAGEGYSRYEILQHYFPGIAFRREGPVEAKENPVSIARFSLRTGEVTASGYPAFLERKLPAGSLFKLIVALYCAAHRPDLIRAHRHLCRGAEAEAPLPDCWLRRGHGEMGFHDALAFSCNRYFASLFRRIDRSDFRRFVDGMLRSLSIDTACPDPQDDAAFARLLAGLDFSLRFRVRDIISVTRVFSDGPVGDPQIEAVRAGIPAEMRSVIRHALADCVTRGTASPEGAPPRGRGEKREEGHNDVDKLDSALFGKTSTVLEGTNRAVSYGIFTGARGDEGIVAVLRNGSGHDAARAAIRLLARDDGSDQDGGG